MRKVALLLLGAALLVPAAFAREGFGFTKKSVTMNRTRPPALNIGARRVAVVSSSERSGQADNAVTLKHYTEEAILGGAGTLAETKAETTIKLALDRLDAHETWEEKEETEYRKTGTRQEWNSKKNRYETKDVYDNVPVMKRVKVVKAELNGSFDILDHNGRIVDSGDLHNEFSRKYDEGRNSATPSEVEDDLLHKAASAVSARLVPARDRIFVMVPKGSFEAAIPYAENNDWERYLSAAEAVPENRNRSQEAYRQYALGVAKEGLAYAIAANDPPRATELLRESVSHYKSATEFNPGETIFTQTYDSMLSSRIPASLPRAEESLAAYETWTAGKRPAGGVRVAHKNSGRMTNQTLIEMANAGLTDENLILAIDDADDVAFDTTPNALIALSKAGVSKNVIAHVQKRAKR